MRSAVLALSLLIPVSLLADPVSAMMERLIADAWMPQPVRVEWVFNEKIPSSIAEHNDWRLAEPRPIRLAGSVIITLERRDENGKLRKTSASGTARVFGEALTVRNRVEAGQPLDSTTLTCVETELTRLNGIPVSLLSFVSARITARTLVPGRIILEQDIKNTPVIRRGQAVALFVTDGGVRIRLNGRALEDGAVGDRISVAADVGKSKSFLGTVAVDSTVLLAR